MECTEEKNTTYTWKKSEETIRKMRREGRNGRTCLQKKAEDMGTNKTNTKIKKNKTKRLAYKWWNLKCNSLEFYISGYGCVCSHKSLVILNQKQCAVFPKFFCLFFWFQRVKNTSQCRGWQIYSNFNLSKLNWPMINACLLISLNCDRTQRWFYGLKMRRHSRDVNTGLYPWRALMQDSRRQLIACRVATGGFGLNENTCQRNRQQQLMLTLS